jgi:putative PIN family toxin of toxin-antitoxin system
MHIVLDTNVLLTCFSSRSKTHLIWQALRQGKFSLGVTTEILAEYEEIIAEQTSAELAAAVLDAILHLPNLRLITRYFKWNLITADPDDDKFVDCAIAAGADYLVTEDKHFKVLEKIPFPTVRVLRERAFMEILRQI